MTKTIVAALLLALPATPSLAMAPGRVFVHQKPALVYRPAPTADAGTAKYYEEEAAKLRAEAARIRQMAVDYKRFSRSPVNPAIPKMQERYSAMAKAADQRAMEAERLANECRQHAKCA